MAHYPNAPDKATYWCAVESTGVRRLDVDAEPTFLCPGYVCTTPLRRQDASRVRIGGAKSWYKLGSRG